MKLFFACLGVGLLIPASLIVLMLALKILSPGTTSGMFLLWFFVWRLPLFVRLFPTMSHLSVGLLSFAVGTFLDVVILTYAAFSVLKRKPRNSTPTT
jgi:hypothetical protein